jgi:hypothetical protein
VKKSREQLETAKLNDAALTLALEGAEGDLATTMTEHSDEWLAALDAESGRARQDAVKALAALEVALADLTQAASASLWISSAKTDGRWDRRVPLASAGSVAPSSARMTANSAPLDRPTLLGFLRELVEPPPQSPRHLVHAQSSDTAS